MTRKRQRLALLAAGLAAFALAMALVLTALEEKVAFFYAPSELVAGQAPDARIRVGGLVVEGSVVRQGTKVGFALGDGAATVPVAYDGVLPDLFREGQGIVAAGRWRAGEGVFAADEVLAKHDENYMPPEVARALKQTGHWQGEAAR